MYVCITKKNSAHLHDRKQYRKAVGMGQRSLVILGNVGVCTVYFSNCLLLFKLQAAPSDVTGI